MTDSIKTSGNVVAFGGGTGMPVLLRGLKETVKDITAVVVVSDDGGSSGELRSLYDMPAPGDLRNVILALSEGPPELLALLRYRFDDSVLGGHNFGNLALAALMKIEGGFEEAVNALCRLCQVRGRVIPMAIQKLALVATHQDGSKSTGEVRVSSSQKPITQMNLQPQPALASEVVLKAIASANIIVFGPGSLFTSVIPHLLMPGIVEALRQSSAKIVYVANIMTEPGETTDFDLKDHVEALFRHGLPRLDAVLCHDGEIPSELEKKYQACGSVRVKAADLPSGVELWLADLLEEGQTIRHDPKSLCFNLLDHCRKVAV
jgi:uncharacterized cofD-like protein